MGLLDRAGLPSEDFRSLGEAIGGRVRVLAWARGADGVVVGLPDRLAIQTGDGWRFVGWHDIDKGGWDAKDSRLRWALVGGGDDEVMLDRTGVAARPVSRAGGASIVVQQRFELIRGRAAMIVARRRLDDDRHPLIWSLSRQGGPFDVAQADQAEAELARLRREYDIAG